MKKILCLLLAVGIVISCSACAKSNNSKSDKADNSTGTTADESWTKVQKAGKLVLGLDDAFPPMGYVDTETGELIGFDIDLAKEVCKRLNIELKPQPIDWKSKTVELNNGNVDCLWNGFSKTPEREKKFNLSTPYMKNEQVILIKTDANFDGLKSLAGNTIGVQSDSSADTALNENQDFKKTLKSVVQIDDYSQAVLELQNGTIDAIAIDEVVARFYLKNNPGAYKILQEKDGKNSSLATEDYIIGFRKTDNALKDKINDALKEMSSDGTMTKISQKWFDNDVTTIGK